MCSASKYPDVVAVSDIIFMSVMDALLQNSVAWCFRRNIRTNKGLQKMRELRLGFFERFGVRVQYSSTYHPQNNPVQWFHRTLGGKLRFLCSEEGSD
ncbi:hypothetical protein AVEN_125771-1 [Araneus ventricosus]|uniref:Integrase catalytic domain-containing protein n=1 Tax=Araneus ventricosus TaxID=182803 RepID=A0A4Y2U2K2_ARAVE|nr:hypothetical protein AVEN_125771-1 [Araneus ventricosus]